MPVFAGAGGAAFFAGAGAVVLFAGGGAVAPVCAAASWTHAALQPMSTAPIATSALPDVRPEARGLVFIILSSPSRSDFRILPRDGECMPSTQERLEVFGSFCVR